MKCLRCGAELGEGELFCSYCGTSTTEQQPQNDPVVSGEINQPITESGNNNFNNDQETFVSQQGDYGEPAGYGFYDNSNINTGNQNSNNIKALLGIFALLVIFVIGSLVVIATLLNSPKKVFDNFIEMAYKSYNEIMGSDMLNNDSVKTEFDIEVNASSENEELQSTIDIINKLGVNGKLEIDKKSEKLYIELNTDYDNEELVNLHAYLENDALYIFLEDLFDKYIKIEAEDVNKTIESNDLTEALDNCVDGIYKALKGSLKDEYFEKEKVKVEIAGKDTKVTKNVMVINEKVYYEISKAVLTELKNNDKFLEGLCELRNSSEEKFADLTKEDIVDEINKALEDMEYFDENDIDPEERIEIIIYTKGFANDFVGIEMDVYDTYKDASCSAMLTEKDTYEFVATENDEMIIEGVAKIGKDYFEYTIYSDDMTLEASCISNGNDGFTISAYMDDGELAIDVIQNHTIKYNEEITHKDVSNSINYEALSQMDLMDIMSKLMEKDVMKNFLVTPGL